MLQYIISNKNNSFNVYILWFFDFIGNIYSDYKRNNILKEKVFAL